MAATPTALGGVMLIVSAFASGHGPAPEQDPDTMAMPAETVPAAAMVPSAPTLPRTGWTALASDQETIGATDISANVLDGNPATIWHSDWSPTSAPFPHWIEIDMHQTQIVSALVYEPRQTGVNGRVGKYAIQLSTDGTTWTDPVTQGTMADDATTKTLRFIAQPTRFVRLTATSEAGNRGPWSSAAELNLLGAPPSQPTAATLPRTGWTATASDQETVGAKDISANVLDGNPATIWHSNWTAGTPFPHWIQIDMHQTQIVSALVYTPRQAGVNGRVGAYTIQLSTDGRTWSAPVSSGNLPDDGTTKTLQFVPQSARYVRMTATSEAGNRGPWTSAAELNVLGDPSVGVAGYSSTLARTGWTAAASDQETVAENGAASNVLDGTAATWWHSRYSAPAPTLPHWITLDMKQAQLVNALTYVPRATGVNGRIGSYSISTSTDGVNFGPAIASGKWADDGTAKTATFNTVYARYVRLTATSEAGNRGSYTSAGEITLAGPANPATAGSWGPVVGLPIVPVATALLPDNKLLAWSSYATDNSFGYGNGYTQTVIIDLSTGVVSPRTITNTGHDMFCPGVVMLADGRIMVTGGADSDKTSIYDPSTNTWAAGGPMNIPRGYQGMTLTSNGSAFVLGGSWNGGVGGKDGELWSPTTQTWTKLSGVPVAPTLTQDPQGAYRADNHEWLYATSDGKILQMGPSAQMNWIDTNGDGSITPAGTRGDSADAMNGNAVAYDIGKILMLGGATAYQNANATNRAYTIDLTSGQPVVTRTGDMAFARAFANSVVLPDGTVAVFGGQNYPVPFSDAGAVMTPELWNPATGQFTALAPMAVPRDYHSVAILLPDGRVFSGGGGLCGTCATNHPDGQIFTPPYLMNADGSLKPRPAITNAPGSAGYGSTISVSTDKPVSSWVLVRDGEATHSVDNDQRRVPLQFTGSGTSYTLSIPSDPGVATPGSYMLFALDANGVPSVASMITIGS